MDTTNLKQQIISLINHTNDKEVLEEILNTLEIHYDTEEFIIKLDEDGSTESVLLPNVDGITEQDLKEHRENILYGEDLALKSRDEKDIEEEKELLSILKDSKKS